jgi:hypothetical protein
MSNTRHSSDASAFNQSRFASSAQYQSGLLGNLVAQRSTLLRDPRHRELVLFLQNRSHQPGGLVALTEDLLARYPGEFSSQAMRHFGFQSTQVYNASQVAAIREDLGLDAAAAFPLHVDEDNDMLRGIGRRRHPRLTYPAAELIAFCQEQARQHLPALLAEFCLDPAFEPAGLNPCPTAASQAYAPHRAHPWCPDLLQLLFTYQGALAGEAVANLVETSISRGTMSALDYARHSGGIVIIEGQERIGKSFSARAWCEARPGLARYVELPSNTDDASFYREIAKALGVASGCSMKTGQIRERIERMLEDSRLMLVMDEGHYIWARANRRDTMPKRICWIMTALANRKIPCAIVATPQFTVNQRDTEQRTQWRSGQFIGRVSHYERLPETLTQDEIFHVARRYLPDADAEMVRAMANVAKISRRGLGLLEFVTKRVRFEVDRAGRKAITAADLARVIKSQALPTDGILSELVGQALKASPMPAQASGRAARRGVAPSSDDLPAERPAGRSVGGRAIQPAVGARSRSAQVGELVTA